MLKGDITWKSLCNIPTCECAPWQCILNNHIQPIISIVITVPPDIYCPNDTTVNVDAGMANANVTWSPLPTANDTNGTAINASIIVCEDSSSNVVMSGDLYPAGTTAVTCRANDTLNVEGSCEFNITVVGMYYLN